MDLEPRSAVTTERDEGEYVSLREILQVIRRRLWVVALTPVAFLGVAVALSLLQTPQYEASVKVLVGQRQDTANEFSLGSDIQGLQQLTRTLTEAVNSRPLAEAVIRQQNLRTTPEDFLEESISVEQIPDTQFIQVSYRDQDPERAQDVANTIGDVFSEQISEISPNASAVTATVWEPAARPDDPVSPNPVRDGALALVLGALVGIGIALLLDYLDDSWQSPEEAEQVSGVPTFGVVPSFVAAGERPSKKAGRS
jgi:capsular polysaccharide biosynthesis protein